MSGTQASMTIAGDTTDATTVNAMTLRNCTGGVFQNLKERPRLLSSHFPNLPGMTDIATHLVVLLHSQRERFREQYHRRRDEERCGPHSQLAFATDPVGSIVAPDHLCEWELQLYYPVGKEPLHRVCRGVAQNPVGVLTSSAAGDGNDSGPARHPPS